MTHRTRSAFGTHRATAPMEPAAPGRSANVLPWRDRGAAQPRGSNIAPLPEPVIEQLADLWCEVLLESLRRRPIESMQKAS
jgi:hypothetical protein